MRFFRAVLAGLLALTLSSVLSAHTKEVTLGTCVWPPYVMDEKSSNRGYAYDIVKKAFEAVGYKVNIKVMNWEKARELAIAGKIDGIFPEYESTENLNHFVYSDPFLVGPLVLYTKADSNITLPSTNNETDFFKQLKAYRFGVVEGYTNVPAFDNNGQLIKKEVQSDKENLEQLYNGDVDFILIDKLNAQYILAHELTENYSKELKPVGPVLAKVGFYIVFSKKVHNVNQIDADFDTGLKKIQDGHVANAIMQKYVYDFLDKENGPRKEN